MSEATATDPSLGAASIVKEAFAVVSVLASPAADATAAPNELEAKGFRVLAVAAGPPAAMRLSGSIALSDAVRDDSAAMVSQLKALGVRMVVIIVFAIGRPPQGDDHVGGVVRREKVGGKGLSSFKATSVLPIERG
jgi:hypothetical protein